MAGICPLPTCVGNTTKIMGGMFELPVHPHVRGEYRRRAATLSTCCGSSPRAWGIPQAMPYPALAGRFIPTCVGNTWWPATASSIRAVHPHVRGEYSAPAVSIMPKTGSSPRAWGIPSLKLLPSMVQRFIPTCVGNTVEGKGLFCSDPVHPHVRGEYARACISGLP